MFKFSNYAECCYPESHFALCRYAEWLYAGHCYAEHRYAECRCVDCHFGDCRGANFVLAFFPGGAASNGREYKIHLGQVFKKKTGRFAAKQKVIGTYKRAIL
jgi:hypothetical protein